MPGPCRRPAARPRRTPSSTGSSAPPADPYARADALVQRLSALINLGRTAEFTRAIEEASGGRPRPRRALPARAPQRAGRAGRAPPGRAGPLRHPPGPGLRGRWAPSTDPDRDTAWGWHDLAMAYSYLSFHGHALGAIERARQLGLAAGIPEETFAAPGIRLRNAVALDHNGDSDGCLRVLRDIAADLNRFRARPAGPGSCGRAASPRTATRRPAGRPSATGRSGTEADPARLLGHGGDSARARDMRQLGQVCLAVADGRPIEAITRLDAAQVVGRDARRGRAGPAAQHRPGPGRRPRRRAPRRPARVPARRAAQRPAAGRLHRRHRRPDRPRGDAPGGGPVRGRGAHRPADRAAQPAPAGAVHRRRGSPGRAGGDRRLRPGRLQGGQHPARPPLGRPGAATDRRGDQPGDAAGRLRGPLRRRRVRGGAARAPA